MGKLTAQSIGEVDIPLSVKLKWHLQGNHYPPVHEVFVPLCEHCVWDGVAYWIDDSTPVAQWISCDKCDWGNE